MDVSAAAQGAAMHERQQQQQQAQAEAMVLGTKQEASVDHTLIKKGMDGGISQNMVPPRNVSGAQNIN